MVYAISLKMAICQTSLYGSNEKIMPITRVHIRSWATRISAAGPREILDNHNLAIACVILSQ